MKQTMGLLSGPLAAILFALGIVLLSFAVPGYSQVHQTVSEIGEVGSPVQTPFTALLCVIAILVLVFAWEIRKLSLRAGASPLAAYFIACMAVSSAGVGIFSFPHPLHNVFGQSELIGYCAPLVLALTWRRDPAAKSVVTWSWVMFGLVMISLALNLAVLDRDGALWAFEKPFYGLVQRSLFACWFGWSAVIGLLLAAREGERAVII